MSSTLKATDSTDHTCRHMTRLLLKERPDGEWTVTQGGVDVEGVGETAAQAAADCCRRVSDGDE